MNFKEPNEMFRSIPNYEGLYQVSNYGNIKSLLKYGKSNIRSLTPFYKKGYLFVNLYKNKIAKSKSIHRLVLLAFYGPSSLEVNHKDGIKHHNYLWNLEYCTSSENQKHAILLGLQSIDHLVGEKHPLSKLNKREILEIRDLYKHKIFLQKHLAWVYNVSKSHINRIIKVGIRNYE